MLRFRQCNREALLSAKQKQNNRPNINSSKRKLVPNTPEPLNDLSNDGFATPKCYKSQIRQHTHDVCKQLHKYSPHLRMAVVSCVVKKLMKHPDTKSKLGSSLSQQTFCPQFTSISKCYLEQTILKIKKYRAKHNLTKLDAAVQQLKQRYSIRSAAKQIGLNYSQVHKLLSFKTNSTRQVTIEDK